MSRNLWPVCRTQKNNINRRMHGRRDRQADIVSENDWRSIVDLCGCLPCALCIVGYKHSKQMKSDLIGN